MRACDADLWGSRDLCWSTSAGGPWAVVAVGAMFSSSAPHLTWLEQVEDGM